MLTHAHKKKKPSPSTKQKKMRDFAVPASRRSWQEVFFIILKLLIFCYTQILNVKTRILPRKSKPDSAGSTDIFASSLRGHPEESLSRMVSAYLICLDSIQERCILTVQYLMEQEQEPYISNAEMVNMFKSWTRDIWLSLKKSATHVSHRLFLH
jgi:hypothetical protein